MMVFLVLVYMVSKSGFGSSWEFLESRSIQPVAGDKKTENWPTPLFLSRFPFYISSLV